jgi:hypothetical protein
MHCALAEEAVTVFGHSGAGEHVVLVRVHSFAELHAHVRPWFR